jgi:hypothetical protein
MFLAIVARKEHVLNSMLEARMTPRLPDRQAWSRRVILLCGILLSGGSLLFPRPMLAVAVIVLALFQFRLLSPKLKRHNIPVLVWILLVLLLAFIRSQDVDMSAIFVRVVNFYLALILLTIYCKGNRDKLAGDLVFLLRPMAYQSILTVLLALVLPSAFMSISTGELDYKTFLMLFTYHRTVEDVGLLVRPDGFFYEPGVFQIYLNIYLFMVTRQQRPMRELVPAVVAVFLTQSTTGLIIASLILLTFSFRFFFKISALRRVGFVLVALALAVPTFTYVKNNIHQKLYGDLAGSSMARQYDFVTGMKVIQDHPFTGIGFSPAEYFKKANQLGAPVDMLSVNDVNGRNTSNGLMNLFYTIGVPLGIALFVGLFRQKYLGQRLLFGMILSLGLVGEALVFTPIFLLFAFSGMSKK